MTDTQRISAHVTRNAGSNAGKYPYGNPLIVTAGGTTVHLDSSLGTDNSAADLLLLSHYHEDHVVGVGESAIETYIHVLDKPAVQSWPTFRSYCDLEPGPWEQQMREQFRWSELSQVQELSDGSIIDVGRAVAITAIHLPGHTAGHCGFFVEPDGVFYLADIELSSFGPFYGDLHSSLRHTRASLTKCAEIDARVYSTFHNKGPYFTRTEFLEALSRHITVIDRRESRLLELLQGDGKTINELVGKGIVYRPGRRPWYADHVERSMCRQHLDELVELGAVHGPEADGIYRLK